VGLAKSWKEWKLRLRAALPVAVPVSKGFARTNKIGGGCVRTQADVTCMLTPPSQLAPQPQPPWRSLPAATAQSPLDSLILWPATKPTGLARRGLLPAVAPLKPKGLSTDKFYAIPPRPSFRGPLLFLGGNIGLVHDIV